MRARGLRFFFFATGVNKEFIRISRFIDYDRVENQESTRSTNVSFSGTPEKMRKFFDLKMKATVKSSTSHHNQNRANPNPLTARSLVSVLFALAANQSSASNPRISHSRISRTIYTHFANPRSVTIDQQMGQRLVKGKTE